MLISNSLSVSVVDINYEKIFQAIFTKSLLKVTLLPVSFSHFLNCTNGIKLCNASDIFQTNCMSLQLYTVKSVESYKLHHEKIFTAKLLFLSRNVDQK